MLELENTHPDELFDSIVEDFADYSIPDIAIVGEDTFVHELPAPDVETHLAECAILAVAQHEDQQVNNSYEPRRENRETTTPTDREPDVLDLAPTGGSNKPPIDLPPRTLQGFPDDEEGAAGRNLGQSALSSEATTQKALEADQILYGPVEIRGKVFGQDVGIRVEGGRYVAPQDYVPSGVSTPVQPLIYKEMATEESQAEQDELQPSDVQDLPQPEPAAPNEIEDLQAFQRAQNFGKLQAATRTLYEPSGDQQGEGASIEFVLEPLPRIEDPESIRYWEQRKAVYEKLVRDAEADPSTDPRLLDNLRFSVEMAEAEAELARTEGKRYFGAPSQNSPSQKIYVTKEALDPPFEQMYVDEEDEDKR